MLQAKPRHELHQRHDLVIDGALTKGVQL